MNNLTFEPVAGPLVLLSAAAILVGLLILRPSFGSLSKLQSWVLIGLRTAAILLTLMALLRPGCVMQVEKPQTGVVEIFVDQTRSMELPHRAAGPTRFESLKRMVAANRALIDKLEELSDKQEKTGKPESDEKRRRYRITILLHPANDGIGEDLT